MPTTYPGRARLAAYPNQPAPAPDVLAALDALAARLDVHDQQIGALQADVIEHIDHHPAADELDGPPCIVCGLPDAAHLIDPDNAEDWQPQHTYEQPDPVVPSTWPVQPLHTDAEGPNVATCGTCWRKWDDGAVTELTPTPAARCPFETFHDQAEAEHIAQHPTGADIETGRDLANDAEQYGAESDAQEVTHMIAQALAAARAEGRYEYPRCAKHYDPPGRGAFKGPEDA